MSNPRRRTSVASVKAASDESRHASLGRMPSLAAAALLLAALAACKPAPVGHPLKIEISGCRKLLPGPACVLQPTRRLRLIVSPAMGDRDLQLKADSSGLPFTAATHASGRVLSFEVPPNVRLLSLSAKGRPDWNLTIEPPSPAVAEAQRKQRTGDMAGAEAFLVKALAVADGRPEKALQLERARAGGALARIRLARGQFDAAVTSLHQTINQFRAAGHPMEACDDALALAFIQLEHQGRYVEAQATLKDAAALAANYPDGQAHVAHFRGVVAMKVGDLRLALRQFRKADDQAQRLGFGESIRATALETAKVYERLGKWQETLRSLAAAGFDEHDPNQCQRADWLTAQGWAWLMANEAASDAASVSAFCSRSSVIQEAESVPSSRGRSCSSSGIRSRCGAHPANPARPSGPTRTNWSRLEMTCAWPDLISWVSRKSR